MRKLVSALATFLLGVSILGVGSANAVIVTYEFDTVFSGTAPSGGTPWMTAVFDDGGVAGSVELTLSTSGLTGNENVKGVYFNLEPFSADLAISHVSGVEPTGTSSSEDAFKADGDGFFDILIEYADAVADRFGAGMESVLQLTAAGLTADMFNALSLGSGNSPDGQFAAAHVRSIGEGGDSGWIAPGDVNVIPIMGGLPLLLSAIGLLGFLGQWWRRLRPTVGSTRSAMTAA